MDAWFSVMVPRSFISVVKLCTGIAVAVLFLATFFLAVLETVAGSTGEVLSFLAVFLSSSSKRIGANFCRIYLSTD